MFVSKSEFLQEINTANQEIVDDKWQGKEDIISNKILNVFRKNCLYYLNSSDYLSDNYFISSIENLVRNMKTLVPNDSWKKIELKQTIEKISNILTTSPLIPGSIEDLTSMNDEVQVGLEVFRELKKQNFSDIPQMIAKWIKYGGFPLSKLNFSKEELLEVAPFLKNLCIDTQKFTNEEIHEIIAKCNQIEILEITSNSLTELPTSWPPSLISLDLSMCHKLGEIKELPEGLQKFLCLSCERLTRLPEKLPLSLKTFYCGGCVYVQKLPILNEGLEKLDLSGTPINQLPKLPSTLIEIDMRECINCDLPDELPDSLIKVLASMSGITKLPLKFPPKLTLSVGYCPNLT